MKSALMTSNAKSAQGQVSIIRVKGYLDLATAEEMETTINDLINANCHKIVVDLGEVEYISSMGWGAFLSRIKEIRESGGDLKLARMQPDVQEVFKILEFEWFLNCYTSTEEATAGFDTNGKHNSSAATNGKSSDLH